MLLIAASLGIIGGLLAGGRLMNLLSVRIRFGLLILAALVLRYGTQALLQRDVDIVDALRMPLFAVAFGTLVAALWLNRSQPGLLLAMAGVGANAIAILVNGGYMPVYVPAVEVVGLTHANLSASFHVPLPEDLGLDFLLAAGPFGDVLPIAIPFLSNVVSVGDVLLAAGLAWFLFSSIAHGAADPDVGVVSMWNSSPRVLVGVDRLGISRPVVLGGGMGVGLPTAAAAELGVSAGLGTAIPSPPSTLAERLSGHPYVRLARDARFSAFWLASIVSLFGDRLHQIALGVMVLAMTGSPLQTGLVFLAATLPNLILGPIAGTLVDRWDQRRIMILSDLVRGALVLLIPFAVEASVWLVYPLVFVITTVSLFFRPAKAAVVPRIVSRSDLMPANGALLSGEALADIAGYPLAGVFVAFLGTNLALAFWVDSITYLASAVLLTGIIVPPVIHAAGTRAAGAISTFVSEMRDGWHFLRGDATLFQNTLVSVFAQLSIGATLALMVVYAQESLSGRVIAYPESYALIEAAVGVGNLAGGFVIGAVGARLRKGWLVIVGFIVMGASTVLLGITSNELLAIAASVSIGIFNLVYVIPSQTLFAERTPPGLMGRVVAIRSSLVLGAMTGAMAVCSGLAEGIDAGLVIATTGLITMVAGVAAVFLPAVRDA